MEFALPAPPSPAEVVRALAVVLTACTAVLFVAGRLRRLSSNALVTVLAYLLFIPAATTLLLVGLSLVYPHHHHDTHWTTDADANYVIDVLVALMFWFVLLFVYRRSWKGSAA